MKYFIKLQIASKFISLKAFVIINEVQKIRKQQKISGKTGGRFFKGAEINEVNYDSGCSPFSYPQHLAGGLAHGWHLVNIC